MFLNEKKSNEKNGLRDRERKRNKEKEMVKEGRERQTKRGIKRQTERQRERVRGLETQVMSCVFLNVHEKIYKALSLSICPRSSFHLLDSLSLLSIISLFLKEDRLPSSLFSPLITLLSFLPFDYPPLFPSL
uniref:Uncharacterized protein n=1 Tax=Cacopsylla melanoneura TaxID=428564 RepID=A0A8D9FHE7_9HEMI